jgi:hypothetical protein
MINVHVSNISDRNKTSLHSDAQRRNTSDSMKFKVIFRKCLVVCKYKIWLYDYLSVFALLLGYFLLFSNRIHTQLQITINVFTLLETLHSTTYTTWWARGNALVSCTKGFTFKPSQIQCKYFYILPSLNSDKVKTSVCEEYQAHTMVQISC